MLRWFFMWRYNRRQRRASRFIYSPRGSDPSAVQAFGRAHFGKYDVPGGWARWGKLIALIGLTAFLLWFLWESFVYRDFFQP